MLFGWVGFYGFGCGLGYWLGYWLVLMIGLFWAITYILLIYGGSVRTLAARAPRARLGALQLMAHRRPRFPPGTFAARWSALRRWDMFMGLGAYVAQGLLDSHPTKTPHKHHRRAGFLLGLAPGGSLVCRW